MSSRKFLSLPAGWREAFPWAVLIGILVAGAGIVASGLQAGWNSLTHVDFWVDLGLVFAFVVVGFTALTARRWVERSEQDG